MAKDPAFLFYSNDFDSATKFFTDEQVGIYMRLLMSQHQHGRLKESQVKFICRSMDAEILAKFKIDENGFYYNERLELELDRRKKFSASRKENIQKRYIKSTSVDTSEEDMKVHMETENEIETIITTPNKKNAEKKFNTMPLPEDGGELPEIIAGSCIELMRITKQTIITKEQVYDLWPVFKIQNLTGKKYYADVGAIHSYFMNWIKTQKFEYGTGNNKNNKKSNLSGKSGGFAILSEALRQNGQ